MVTAGTYQKAPLFAGTERLKGLQEGLLKYAEQYGWRLEAWAVFPNHYHFIAHSPAESKSGAESLTKFLGHFHGRSATWINRLDQQTGRKVWFNFWETRLSFEKSYFARLHYVHKNAVKHGLVTEAAKYPWCSASWFERTATQAQLKTIYSFKTDQLKILDDF